MRTKGSKNKRTLEIEEKLRRLKCDPIAGMAKIAADQANSPELRGKMYAELAQYVAPKRKAIEHSGSVDGKKTVVIDLGGSDHTPEASS